MATVQARYIDAAIAFYCQPLGFNELMHPSPMFAMLSRGDLRLVLSQPGGQNPGGGSTLADGRKPEPGGWNRFVIQGVGGNQALVEDPSGNPIELFQPLQPEARLAPTI